MAEESELHELRLQIEELRDQLRQERAARLPPDLSEDDLPALLAVRRAVMAACGHKHCAGIQVNIYCSTVEEGLAYSRFMGLGVDPPAQEPPPDSA